MALCPVAIYSIAAARLQGDFDLIIRGEGADDAVVGVGPLGEDDEGVGGFAGDGEGCVVPDAGAQDDQGTLGDDEGFDPAGRRGVGVGGRRDMDDNILIERQDTFADVGMIFGDVDDHVTRGSLDDGEGGRGGLAQRQLHHVTVEGDWGGTELFATGGGHVGKSPIGSKFFQAERLSSNLTHCRVLSKPFRDKPSKWSSG